MRDRFGGGLGDARFLFLRPNQLHLSNDLERPPHAAQGLHLSSTYTPLPPPLRMSRAPHPVQLLWPACSPISARRGPKSRFSRRLTPLTTLFGQNTTSQLPDMFLGGMARFILHCRGLGTLPASETLASPPATPPSGTSLLTADAVRRCTNHNETGTPGHCTRVLTQVSVT